MSSDVLPVIDIAGFLQGSPAQRAQVSREWDHALSSLGMCTIIGHGMSQTAIDNMCATHVADRAIIGVWHLSMHSFAEACCHICSRFQVQECHQLF